MRYCYECTHWDREAEWCKLKCKGVAAKDSCTKFEAIYDRKRTDVKPEKHKQKYTYAPENRCNRCRWYNPREQICTKRGVKRRTIDTCHMWVSVKNM